MLPHPPGRSVPPVLQELGESEHRLRHQSQQANSLHEDGDIDEDVGEESATHHERQAELHIILKPAPIPEVFLLEICNESQTLSV